MEAEFQNLRPGETSISEGVWVRDIPDRLARQHEFESELVSSLASTCLLTTIPLVSSAMTSQALFDLLSDCGAPSMHSPPNRDETCDKSTRDLEGRTAKQQHNQSQRSVSISSSFRSPNTPLFSAAWREGKTELVNGAMEITKWAEQTSVGGTPREIASSGLAWGRVRFINCNSR